jgi:putative nucleotidyltransferase with HDIG domain
MTNHQGRGFPIDSIHGESPRTRRVAAWCAEIAAQLDLPAPEREVLKHVVPLQQGNGLVLDSAGWRALSSDLGISQTETPLLNDPVTAVLHSLHGGGAASERIRRLALILEQCDDLDVACEIEATISGEPELTGLDGIVSEVGAYFVALADGDIQGASSRLPVFPVAVYRAIKLLDNMQANLDDVEALVSSDQTLALHLIRAANSVLMNSATRVKTVRKAVLRIGLELARQIISAACLRTMFESKHSQALWNHSLDVAESAANIAGRTGLASRDEAFLAGLMHDIGKLVILNLPAASLARQDRLTRSGCPDVIVERVILRESHAAIGARLLRNWRFAESIAECTENHHTPERSASPLSSIVYLADLQTAPEQELESEWRHQWTLNRVGLPSAPDWSQERAHPLSSLRFAAAA